MPSGDSRKDFICSTAGHYFGLQPNDDSLSEITSGSALNSFLDDGSSSVLYVRLGGKKIHVSSTIDVGNDEQRDGGKDKALVFYKVRPEVITPDNIHTNVFVSSILDSAVSTLYQSVHNVYVPMMLKDDKLSQSLDPKLQSLLGELDAGLGSVLRRRADRSAPAKTADDTIGGILTPADEFQYWADMTSTGKRGEEKDRAQYFSGLFQKQIAPQFASMASMTMSAVMDLIEETHDVLDEVWKQTDFDKPYPESRMRRLLEVIASALIIYIQHTMGQLNLWRDPFLKVKDGLRLGQNLCERWSEVCEKLTNQFWKGYGPHPWKGDRFVPEILTHFARRLEEILNVRATHEKLSRLLSTQEKQELRMTDAFNAFANVGALQYNPYTQPLWAAAVAQFDRAVGPAEQRIAGKLRAQIRGLDSNPHQLLHEFDRYRELVRRPSLAKELSTERELLLGQLNIFIRQTRDSFMQKTGAGGKGIPKGKNLPESVNNIVFAQQLIAKVELMLKLGTDLLSDLHQYKSFRQDASDLLDELRGWQQEAFADWSRDVLSQIDDLNAPLSLETSGRLMDLNTKDGKLHVSYGDRLVTLVREVRLLLQRGFAVPAKIQHVAQVADKFKLQGNILKQVAHFYDTIDQQMITCQQPMMLQSALAFERVIKNPKAGSKSKGDVIQVTWDNVEELEKYIGNVKKAAEQLSTENRQLRRCHYNICEKVVQMMGTDLLRQQQKWKDSLMEIRHIMANLVDQGFAAENMKMWKAHWDRQLYKALEHQYQMGLEALNENLPEIRVELTYIRQKIQFRPAIEEIKSKYYREMKKFIGIPNLFKGVGGDAAVTDSIFVAVIDRNASGFLTCYQKAAELFKRLDAVQNIFKEWVVLGAIDIDEFAFQQLKSLPDWERNFKAVKARGRDAEKLPNEIKVDCIRVSAIPIKSIIDDHLQRLFDALLGSLRRSIQSDVTAIDSYLTDAMETLSQRPQTIEEIGDANIKHLDYAKKKKVPTATLR